MASPAIELRGVTKRFATPNGGIYTALHDLTMEVGPGEFCAVVGPTGCGKSTTLALISGLERVSRPGRRTYVDHAHIPRIQGGMGTAIISTSRGVMTGHEARQKRVGGEVVARVW